MLPVNDNESGTNCCNKDALKSVMVIISHDHKFDLISCHMALTFQKHSEPMLAVTDYQNNNNKSKGFSKQWQILADCGSHRIAMKQGLAVADAS